MTSFLVVSAFAFAFVVFVAGAVFLFRHRASVVKEVAREAAQGDAVVAKVVQAVDGAKQAVATVQAAVDVLKK